MEDKGIFDLLVVGGGINGVAIARDAAGRGLKVVLVEAGDLGGATSSASSKLVHGGLRYLEFHAFGLVRKALQEREIILRNAPHISWPLPFLLPVTPGRGANLLRAGLFLYDHLARHHEVPGSERVALQKVRAGPAFAPHLQDAFRYWDGWIDDARLVILTARDAADRGAAIWPRDALVSARFADGLWSATMASGRQAAARFLVNATGPWVERVAADVLGLPGAPPVALVQGAHIVTRRVNRGDDAWTLQQPDGRIIFVIPWEQDFSLIGTTETPIAEPAMVTPTAAEEEYLLGAVNRSLARPLTLADIVHRFAGIRPLILEEGKGARETTRDWRLVRHADVPALSVVGGKITTCRRLAEDVLEQIAPKTEGWTRNAPLPGGDIPRRRGTTAQEDFLHWMANLQAAHAHYDPAIVARMARLYGTHAAALLEAGLGENLGGIFAAELDHMRTHEWARTTDDILWRRTKLGLRLGIAEVGKVRRYMGG
ncbi:MAG: glycerol-3-phosphate dehydrogenase [Sphingomonadaceae bacterium]